jgi:hypothetical protein
MLGWIGVGRAEDNPRLVVCPGRHLQYSRDDQRGDRRCERGGKKPMTKKRVGVALVLISMLAACAPVIPALTSTPTPELPPAVVAAEEALSQSQDIPLAQIEVVSYESRDWPDGCLGLGKPGEGCIDVITPGYLVVLQAEGQRYVYRTDDTGNMVRREE